jgi:hypothetical protein
MCLHDDQARALDLDAALPDEPAHDLSRRGLLRAAAVGAAALGLSGGTAAVATAQEPAAARPGHVPTSRISIQLYTLRNQLAADLDGTLSSLADIGYTRVEHAGFAGRSVTEFKAALDKVGIRATSGHVAIPQPFDAKAWAASLRDAKVLGSRYIVNPGRPGRPSPAISTGPAGWPAPPVSASVTTTTTGSSSRSSTSRAPPGTTS